MRGEGEALGTPLCLRPPSFPAGAVTNDPHLELPKNSTPCVSIRSLGSQHIPKPSQYLMGITRAPSWSTVKVN